MCRGVEHTFAKWTFWILSSKVEVQKNFWPKIVGPLCWAAAGSLRTLARVISSSGVNWTRPRKRQWHPVFFESQYLAESNASDENFSGLQNILASLMIFHRHSIPKDLWGQLDPQSRVGWLYEWWYEYNRTGNTKGRRICGLTAGWYNLEENQTISLCTIMDIVFQQSFKKCMGMETYRSTGRLATSLWYDEIRFHWEKAWVCPTDHE